MRKLLTLALVALGMNLFSQTVVNMCYGGAAVVAATNPSNLANPAYTVNPGKVNSSSPNFTVSPSATSNFTLITGGTTTNSAFATTSVVVTVSVLPVAVLSPTLFQPSCTSTVSGFNLGLSFMPNSSSAPAYSVQWATNVPNGITSISQYSVASGVAPGSYTAVVTADGGCQIAYLFTLIPQPAPANYSFVPNGLNAFSLTCVNVSQTVGVSNPVLSYTWTSLSQPANNNTLNTFGYTTAGVYTVIATNTVSGCQLTRTLGVYNNTTVPVFTLTPANQVVTCSNSAQTTVTLTAVSLSANVNFSVFSPNTQNVWLSNNYTTAYLGAPASAPYTVICTNGANGCSSVKNFTIAANGAFPTYSLISSPSNFTLGCFAKSTATVTMFNGQTTPPGGQINYALLIPGATSTVGSFTSTPAFSVNTAGTYTAIVKDANNSCETRQAFSILSNTAAPNVDSLIASVPRITCTKPTGTISVYSDSLHVDYLWTLPNNLGTFIGSVVPVAGNTVGAAATASIVGTYTIKLTEQNNTCFTTRTITIEQDVFTPSCVPTPTSNANLTCANPTIILTTGGTSRSPYNPNKFNIQNVKWQGPSPQVDAFASSQYTAGVIGQYTCTIVDPYNGCEGVGTLTVGDLRDYPVVNNPTAPAPSVLDCGAKSASLSPIITSSLANLTYSWSAPSTATVSGKDTKTLTTNVPGTFTVVVTNTANACATTVTMSAINGSLQTGIASSKTTGFAPLEVEFTNNSTSSLGTASINTVWSFGIDSVLTAPSTTIAPKITYTQPGTYVIKAWISKGTCLGTASVQIIVDAPSNLIVPNIFSPNGDKVNDLFFLKATGLSSIDMSIYDRWGHLVYQLNTTKGQVEWDGTTQTGAEAAEGVYFYTLKATGKDGVEYEKKGNITLVR